MKAYADKFFAFLAGAFTDDNGQPSFSRIGTAMATCFACGWVTCIVRHAHTLPDFGGVSLFIGTLYGLNVVKNGVTKGGNNG